MGNNPWNVACEIAAYSCQKPYVNSFKNVGVALEARLSLARDNH
jgi:hypothetical protein